MSGSSSSPTPFFVNRQTAFLAVSLLLALTSSHAYWLFDVASALQAGSQSSTVDVLGRDGFFAVWAVIFALLLVVLFKSNVQLFRRRPVAVVTWNGVDFYGAEHVHVPSYAISRVYERVQEIRDFGGKTRSIHIELSERRLAERVNRTLPFPLGKIFNSGNSVTIYPIWIEDASHLVVLLSRLADEGRVRTG